MKDEEQNQQDPQKEALNICNVSKSLTPHCCPVCRGNGIVPNGFYNQTSGYWTTNSTAPDTCRSCQGTGVVWG